METVTIQTVTPKKTGAKNGKPWVISECLLADGRKVDTFDSFAPGEVVEVTITPNAKDPSYNAQMKKAGKKQSDWQNLKNAEQANKALDNNNVKEQRITMLACQKSAAIFYQQRQANEQTMMDFAKKLFDQANKGIDDLPF